MNRFRTKRKGKDDGGGGGGGLGRTFRRKKQEEPKPEFDLNTALPSHDEFRTSLLMTGLSARFSMLREQDDPNTKIGKASDDSVLFPKRQSRLMDYGYSGGLGRLADIAEVESIKGPPSFSRMNSFVSDDADSLKGGSMMNRSKPTEGNNLFGGRQKIYKITDGAASNGAMAGRALYDDDVAISAFQRWRQAEKERGAVDGGMNVDPSEGVDGQRPESPVLNGYNRKRETSSTSSSGRSMGRDSTAATSVASQRTASTKDWQSVSTAPTSAGSTPSLDRNLTRTRRLYEQGLTQELHEQQSSALSRIDTLSRQRNLGSRTPDLSQATPSPTANVFGDRFGFERRQILTKASAPNLRSTSPPTTGSSIGTMDLGIKVPTVSDAKNNDFGGSPPLSPPISETGDHPMLPIQPNDRGKATAMGVFQKPVQPYDESKYAQRQLQLQQGRETPTQRFRAESNASFVTGRSRSSSSLHRQPLDAKAEPTLKTHPTVPEEATGISFLDDSDASPIIPAPKHAASPQLFIQRPSDSDHPAFRRQSAIPTPLSIGSRASGDPSPSSEMPDFSIDNSHQASPEDSPTLGPGPPGLSGMVRQHLRSDSNASSVYGAAPQTAGLGPHTSISAGRNSELMDGLGAKSNPWNSQEQDWTMSYYGVDAPPEKLKAQEEQKVQTTRQSVSSKTPSLSSKAPSRSSAEVEETDEFASQLANARRRVRERLNSYVESDSSRAGSPHRSSEALNESTRSNPLGIGLLKSKSSRGSLVDRSREASSQSKAMKMLGIASSTMSTSPSPNKQAFEEKDAATLAPMQEEVAMEEAEEEKDNHEPASDADSKSLKDDENIHPGLRAFRNARRELQRRKELETLARHQVQPHPQTAEQTTTNQTTTLGVRQRTPSMERKPPPMLYQRAPGEEAKDNTGPNVSSEQLSMGRDRSESRASNGRSDSRPPPRPRNNSTPYDDHPSQLGPNGSAPPRPHMLRSPGLPGTDIRRSPIMPPTGYSGSATSSAMPSPRYFDRSASAGNLQPGKGGQDTASAQPSPISPLPPMSPLGSIGLPASPYAGSNGSAAGTPTTLVPSPRRPSAPSTPGFGATASTLNESMKRVVNKADISEPTFIMSTSRVPTVSLPQSATSPETSNQGSHSGPRSRADSNTGRTAPPLPPLNPMRRRDTSGTRGGVGNFLGRNGGGPDDGAVSLSSPHLPLSPSNTPSTEDLKLGQSSFSASDDERNGADRQPRWRSNGRGVMNRQAPPMKSVAPGRLRDRGNSPPFVATGPPVSKAVFTGPASGLPGGMI